MNGIAGTVRPYTLSLLHEGGRLSPLRIVAFLVLLAPGVWLLGRSLLGDLGPRPLVEINHQSGLWAIRLLFASLAITPIRHSWRWHRLLIIRRMIGVATFIYAMIHLTFYAADQGFQLWHIASEIIHRIYLTIGFVALVGLAILATTSTDRAVRRLGRRWQQLHRIIYGVAILGVIHFFLQSKLLVGEPIVMGGLLLWLLFWRGLRSVSAALARHPLMLALLSLVSAAASLGAEALHYHLKTGVAASRIIVAALQFQLGIRPAWYVLAISLVMALGASIRRRPETRIAAALA